MSLIPDRQYRPSRFDSVAPVKAPEPLEWSHDIENEFGLVDEEDIYFDEYNNTQQDDSDDQKFSDYDDEAPLPTGPAAKRKEKAPKAQAPKVFVASSTWSIATTTKITKELIELVPDEDDEDDIIIDDIDFITGNATPSTIGKQIPVAKNMKPLTPEQLESLLFKPETTVVVNPIIEMRQKLEKVYAKDGVQIEKYISSRIAPYVNPDIVKPKVTKIITKFVTKVVKIKQEKKKPEMDNYVCNKDVEISLPQEFEDEESEKEDESEEEESKEESEDELKEPIIEISEEQQIIIDKVRERLLAKAAKDKELAVLQRVNKPVTLNTQNSTPSKRKNQKRLDAAKQKELQKEYLGFKLTESVGRDTSRTMLLKVYEPQRIMACYVKLLTMQEEIQKCITNQLHTIMVPQFAVDPSLLVASPVRMNVVHTPIVPIPLCRSGFECKWFTSQCYKHFDLPIPKHLLKIKPCYYMHVDSKYDSISALSNKKFIQCSIVGCTATEHYTPNDSQNVEIIHMTPNTEECGHDKRNFCLNILGDGCCRIHYYTGPLIVSLVLRCILASREKDPSLWPLYDNTYLFRASLTFMTLKVPTNNTTDTFEKRLKGIKGLWPAQRNNFVRSHRY